VPRYPWLGRWLAAATCEGVARCEILLAATWVTQLQREVATKRADSRQLYTKTLGPQPAETGRWFGGPLVYLVCPRECVKPLCEGEATHPVRGKGEAQQALTSNTKNKRYTEWEMHCFTRIPFPNMCFATGVCPVQVSMGNCFHIEPPHANNP